MVCTWYDGRIRGDKYWQGPSGEAYRSFKQIDDGNCGIVYDREAFMEDFEGVVEAVERVMRGERDEKCFEDRRVFPSLPRPWDGKAPEFINRSHEKPAKPAKVRTTRLKQAEREEEREEKRTGCKAPKAPKASKASKEINAKKRAAEIVREKFNVRSPNVRSPNVRSPDAYEELSAKRAAAIVPDKLPAAGGRRGGGGGGGTKASRGEHRAPSNLLLKRRGEPIQPVPFAGRSKKAKAARTEELSLEDLEEMERCVEGARKQDAQAGPAPAASSAAAAAKSADRKAGLREEPPGAAPLRRPEKAKAPTATLTAERASGDLSLFARLAKVRGLLETGPRSPGARPGDVLEAAEAAAFGRTKQGGSFGLRVRRLEEEEANLRERLAEVSEALGSREGTTEGAGAADVLEGLEEDWFRKKGSGQLGPRVRALEVEI